ncbi:MAG: hypothetical protein MUO77_07980 [Anaerolineales bacterium]|nr:hypothetical protein [Anaerolineales bacterium]
MLALAKTWWKILIIALAGAGAAFGLHQIIPVSASMAGPFSPLVEAIGFPAVVCGYFVVAFSLMLVTFVLIQEHLTGTRLSKGLRCGFAMTIIWYVGLLETNSLVGTPLVDEAVMAIADIIPVFLMSLLLAYFSTTDTPVAPARKAGWRAIPVIALCYFVGRILAYTLIHIESGYIARSLATLIWTASMGLAVGISYWLLVFGLTDPARKTRLLWFGGLFFGLNWLVFNLFAPLVLGASFIDIIIRVGIDVLCIMLGVFIAEKL